MPGYTTDTGQDQKFKSVSTPSSTVCSPLTHNMSGILLCVWVLGLFLHILHLHTFFACDEQLFVFGEKKPKTNSLSARSAPQPMALEIVGNSK